MLIISLAGAGIGYRVVQDTTGPGTHLLPRPAVTEFGILYPKNGQGGRGGNGDGNDFNGNRNNGIPGIPNDDGNTGGVDGIGGVNGAGGGNGGSGGGGGGDFPGLDDNSIDLDPNGPFGDRDGFDDINRKNGRPGGDRPNADFPRGGGGTIITNTGDTILFRSGILPGASARAHVQNIDLKPYGDDGALSPSEALRRDERRSLRQRFRG